MFDLRRSDGRVLNVDKENEREDCINSYLQGFSWRWRGVGKRNSASKANFFSSENVMSKKVKYNSNMISYGTGTIYTDSHRKRKYKSKMQKADSGSMSKLASCLPVGRHPITKKRSGHSIPS